MVDLLTTPLGQEALAAAMAQSDPGSLAAAAWMRARFPAELAAAALTQADLRRRAVTKFGAAAAGMFFTRDGLEQASRPQVAAHHAARFRAAGVSGVLDLGCGIGSDALAFLAAGLAVTAIEIGSDTAEIARLNLGDRAQVQVGDAEVAGLGLLQPGWGVFCDPGRRTSAGRSWRVEDFTPAWSFVQALLADQPVVGVKLGPGLPHGLIPAVAEAEWVSHRGSTVEVGLWTGPGCLPGARVALVLSDDGRVLPDHRLVLTGPPPVLDVSTPRRFVYEPDGAVIRAGGVTTIGAAIQGALLDPQIAYLTSDELVTTAFATAFEVLDVFAYKEKVLRQWLRERQIGTVEIKKRGVDVDPAELRKRLRPSGSGRVTVILTRTPQGVLAIMARRVQ